MQKDILIPTDSFNRDKYKRFIIVADIGGNHAYTAIMGIDHHNNFEIIFKYGQLTKDIDSISVFLNYALKDAHETYGIQTDTGCIGVAGPVIDSSRKEIKLTHWNLVIKVDDILLCTLLKKVILLNDFEAVGYGIDFLTGEKDMVAIAHKNHHIPKKKEDSNFCVIGAGYGLGSCISPYDKQRKLHVPIACEAGHMEFGVESPIDYDFQLYLQEKILSNKMKIPDAERYVSGRGVIDLWHFLRSKKLYPTTDITKNIDFLLSGEKISSIFINYYNDHLCKKVVDLFMKYYAQFARTMALVSVCYGGMYIGGGIASRHIELFQSGEFMKEFERSDKKEDILIKIPIYILTNKNVGLYGCCNVAINFLDSI